MTEGTAIRSEINLAAMTSSAESFTYSAVRKAFFARLFEALRESRRQLAWREIARLRHLIDGSKAHDHDDDAYTYFGL